jgi:hypothetical protein
VAPRHELRRVRLGGNGLYATSFGAVLRVDARSPIQLEGTRNATTHAGQNTPYRQRLNLMGYLE